MASSSIDDRPLLVIKFHYFTTPLWHIRQPLVAWLFVIAPQVKICSIYGGLWSLYLTRSKRSSKLFHTRELV